MNFSALRKQALKVLRGWNAPPILTESSSNGSTLTLRILNETMAQFRTRYQAPPVVVVPPQFVERFAETSINTELYGGINILVDPTCPPNTAYVIQQP